MLESENYKCVSRVEVMENEGFAQFRFHRDAKFLGFGSFLSPNLGGQYAPYYPTRKRALLIAKTCALLIAKKCALLFTDYIF